jgi:hypothetical protein
MSALRESRIPNIRFSGPKLLAPIRVQSPFHRDALIQASLDPAVRSIGFVGTTKFEGLSVVLEVTTIDRDGQHYYLDLVEDREPQDIHSEGLALRALHNLGLTALEKTAADILADPLHANCKAIWKHYRDHVDTIDQFEVLHILSESGPQSLGRLAQTARISEEAILAMACRALIEIDIHNRPLGSRSMVRRGSRVRLSPPQVIAAAGI